MHRFFLGALMGAMLAALAMGSAMAVRDGRVPELPRIELPKIDLARLDLAKIDLSRLDLSQIDLRAVDAAPVVRRTRAAIDAALPTPKPAEVNVVLSRDGGRLVAGPDNARLGWSSVLIPNGLLFVDVPAYRGSDERWAAVKRCVRGRFSGFAVNVLDEAPARGDYVVVHVGGRPEMLGQASTVQGLAPHTGRLLPNAPVFVFTQNRPSAATLCETAAHEIGHALGLDHSRLCSDIMSYGDCGKKTFRERSAPCGEYASRECTDGAPQQSSARKLEALVGRRSGSPAIS